MSRRPRRKARSHLPHPHDSLVKWAFKQAPHAAGLLRAVLSAEELSAVDLATLRVEDGSYVDAALQHLYSDLAFSAAMYGERVYFYALVEQQRDQERWMLLRVGQYTMRMWDTLVRDPSRASASPDAPAQPSRRPRQMERLPPILPIVLYNGRTPWTAPTAFEDLVHVPPAARATLSPHVPHFKVRLVDLSGGGLDSLVESALTALGKVVIWCLSVAGDDERLEAEIDRVAGALDEVLRSPDANAALGAILRYLCATHPDMPADKLRDVVERAAGEEAREAIVTWLDDLEEKGRKEGRAEGRAQALVDLLATRFGRVPRDVKKRILEADEKHLRAWTFRVLQAGSIEEVLVEAPARPAPAARSRAQRV